jgi:hypothetical protein
VHRSAIPWMGLVIFGALAISAANAEAGVAKTEAHLTNISSSLPLLAPAQSIATDPFPSMLATPSPALLHGAIPSSHAEQDAVAAPEPTSLSLLAVGLGMIAVARRQRKWFR